MQEQHGQLLFSMDEMIMPLSSEKLMPVELIHTIMAFVFIALWAMIAQFSICKPKSNLLDQLESRRSI